MTDDEPREFYLIQGGSPAAQRIAARLDDSEVIERFRVAFTEFSVAVERDVLRPLGEAFARAAEQMGQMLHSMREAGLIPDEPPQDNPRAKALWARQHRNTGPDRQIQHQHRNRA